MKEYKLDTFRLEDTEDEFKSNKDTTEEDLSFQELVGESEATRTITSDEVEKTVLEEVLKSSYFKSMNLTVTELKEKINTPLSELFTDSNTLIEVLVNLEFSIRLKRFFDFEEIKAFKTLSDIIDLIKNELI